MEIASAVEAENVDMHLRNLCTNECRGVKSLEIRCANTRRLDGTTHNHHHRPWLWCNHDEVRVGDI